MKTMNYKKYLYICCCILFLIYCNCISKNSNSKTNNSANTKNGQSKSDNNYRVSKLREIIGATKFVELPFKVEFDQDAEYSIINMDIDSIKISYLIFGVLPDTSTFYGFITGFPEDVMNIEIVTFNKLGLMIDKKRIIENNCLHLIETDLYCNEYAVIHKDLSIDYYYQSTYILLDHAYEGQRDTVCEHYEKRGKIQENGTIIFENRQEYECK
ncbi:MAG: hypothetical protein LBT27_02620 [Prevotellaceae bacterium]|jgi:hypothetical protein|nr:hypothetical protein [Prevotellaceae bacterium]